MVDPKERRLTRNGEAVAIEPRAFDVLVVLLQHHGSLVPKADLLDAAWPDVHVTDNALTRAVARLRRTLGDDARSPRYIETVPAGGYRFVATLAPKLSPEDVRTDPGDPPARDATVRPEPSEAPGRRRTLILGIGALGVLAVIGAAGLLGGGIGSGSAGTKMPPASDAPASAGHAEAEVHYRHGRDHYRRQSRLGNEQAIELFQLAIDRAPDHALAHSGLANAYAMRVVRYGFPARWREDAETSARRALALEPGLPEAHKALGLVSYSRERYQESLDYYLAALESNPAYEEALYNAASTAFDLGRWDQAVQLQLRDVERPIGRGSLAIYLFELGLDDSAERLARGVLEDEPLTGYLLRYLALRDGRSGDFGSARRRLDRLTQAYPMWAELWRAAGDVELTAGRYGVAERHYSRAIEATEERLPEAELGLAAARLRADPTAPVDAILDRIDADATAALERGSDWYGHPLRLAISAALEGRNDDALIWLERAVGAGHRGHRWDLVHPAFESILEAPEFRRSMDMMAADVASMKTRVLNDSAASLDRLAGPIVSP
ncbi:MAG: winged helix-turn-helix domain-containing protein [Acidobacteriota bacterium]